MLTGVRFTIVTAGAGTDDAVMTLHADPNQILDPYEVANKLSALLPDKTSGEILTALSRKTRMWNWTKDYAAPARRHFKPGLPGIFITPSNLRTYPNGREAAHILGQVNRDGRHCGVEKAWKTN